MTEREQRVWDAAYGAAFIYFYAHQQLHPDRAGESAAHYADHALGQYQRIERERGK